MGIRARLYPGPQDGLRRFVDWGFTITAIGLIPALKLSRADLAAIMKDGGAQSSIAFGRTRLRQLLLAAQVGASCVLLVLAGLMLRSAQRVLIDVGFDVERVAVVVAPLRAHGIISTQITSYWNGIAMRPLRTQKRNRLHLWRVRRWMNPRRRLRSQTGGAWT